MEEFRPFEPSPETALTSDLMGLAEEWEKLGIDPDDFCRCGKCHRFFADMKLESDPVDMLYCECPA